MSTSPPSRRHPLIWLLWLFLHLYDLVTLPCSLIVICLCKVFSTAGNRMTRTKPDDPFSAYTRTDVRFRHYTFKATTIPQLVALLLKNNPPTMPSLGERTVTRCTADGQLELSGYVWYSLAHVNSMIDQLAKAFIQQGIGFQERVLIYSETRLEWFLCAQAIFRIGAVLTTLFSTLNKDGLIHGINETQVEHIILTDDLVASLLTIIDQLPSVKYLYVIANKRKKTALVSKETINEVTAGRVTMLKYPELFDIARSSVEDENWLKDRKVTASDVAVVLYTSGSTGKPKGVIQTHRNFIAVCQGLYSRFGASIMHKSLQHTYYAFLPLAHTFELVAEMVFFGAGISIGYGTPRTIMDNSPGLVAGQKGDLSVLQPTIMCSVPLVLDRIRMKLSEKLGSENSMKAQVFQLAFDYKRKWARFGLATPLLNWIICQKAKEQVFGGRLHFMIVGGAALSEATHELIQLMLDTKILIGYGLTETCAGCFVSDFDQCPLGTTSLLHGCQFRLLNWSEGNYYVTDKPNARGELVIGGPSITSGYFKQDDLTAESYEVDENGVRWFKTGDIAEVDEAAGVIRIIDRKKDLVKMANGKFISLGTVESQLKCFPLADYIAVFASPLVNYLIALISPNPTTLNAFLEAKDGEAFEANILEQLKAFCGKAGLTASETPQRIKLCTDEWTIANGLLTASLKINRNAIRAHYAEEIKAMLGQ